MMQRESETPLPEARANEEINRGERFAFGANWARFLGGLSEEKIAGAESSLRAMLGVESLAGLRFLDAGSGSGLTSLAARRLGARVTSFDFDSQSVACTTELRRRYYPGDPEWKIESGSVLDAQYVQRLGTFDVVCSWGVLHHTGNMHKALENITQRVAPGGLLYIALYNDQGWISSYWTMVKRRYNRGPLSRLLLIVLHAPYLVGVRIVVRALTGRLRLERGMSYWYDMLDWLGGFPFEVARPKDVVDSYVERGFTIQQLRTVGSRAGCNEFVLRRASPG